MGKNGPDMGPKHAPPFEPKSESIWAKTLALCLNQKNLKQLGKNWETFEGKNLGQRLYTKILKYMMLQTAFRIANTPAEPQTGLRW